MPSRSFLALCVVLAWCCCTALPPCVSDEDCSLNGVCDVATGVCACDAPWTGGSSPAGSLPDCALLEFTPSPVNDCGPACVFHGLTSSWTSWGMSIIRAGPVLHGYVAEMANACGLDAWTRGSQVVRAVGSAADPTAQFVREDIVVNPLSHNPQAITAPDGTIVICEWRGGGNAQPLFARAVQRYCAACDACPRCARYWSALCTTSSTAPRPAALCSRSPRSPADTLFDGWPQNGPPKNCTAGEPSAPASLLHRLALPADGPLREGGVGNCTVVAEPSNCNPGPCWSCNITLHHATRVDAAGPWASLSTQIIGLSNVDNIQNYNPAPLVLPNGSIALMIHTDDNQGWSGEVLAIADSWHGPYRVTVPDDSINNEPKKQEDPYLWRDVRGNWHTVRERMEGGGSRRCCAASHARCL